MMWRDTVELIAVQRVDDGGGGFTEAETLRAVFANRKSVRQSEFYQAHMTGLKPEIMFEVRYADYAGETKLRHDGRRYVIVRTFSRNEEVIELVCQREVGA